MAYEKANRRELLAFPYEDRLEVCKDVIKDVLKRAKRPLIQFSGGADSVFMAHIIHQIDKTVPLVFNDWGLFLPKQEEFCRMFAEHYGYKFYYSYSGMDWKEFVTKYGFPIFKGTKWLPESEHKKYHISKKCRMLKDRCWSNIVKTVNPDYFFVGVLADESPQRKNLFLQHGFEIKKTHGTLVKPIALITKDEVLKYLDDNNILYPKEYYEDTFDGKHFKYKHCDLGCFMCGISFNKYGFGRLGRLARDNPSQYRELMKLGLETTLQGLIKDYPDKTSYISDFLRHYPVEAKKTAYDMDGVIMPLIQREKAFQRCKKAEKEEYERKKRLHFATAEVLIRPAEKSWSIISSRRERYRGITEEWLSKNNLKPTEVILMEGNLTFRNIITHKIKWLKERNIERYYEDDPEIVEVLRKRIPSLEVIHIPRTEKTVVTASTIPECQESLF